MATDINFILKKYQELKDSDEIIIVLKPRDYSKFDIKLFNQSYKDARAFETTYNEEKIIFLKKIKYVSNITDIIAKAKKAYQNRNLDESIALYEELIQTRKTPIAFYARLGLLYLNKNNITKALLFFKIATARSSNTAHNKYNFTELINKITKNKDIKDEDEKKFIKINIEEFTRDLNDYYGYRVREVCLLMDCQGMTIEEACFALKINEEDKNMITLLIAIDAYARGDITLGDNYVRIIEKAKNKSVKVKKLIKELRKDKLFYQNRVDENYKPLLRVRKID